MIANVLSIAGSDPSGGAGIQADLKAFAALGSYGMAIITALTAQNTRGVQSFQTVEPAFVAEHIDAIFAWCDRRDCGGDRGPAALARGSQRRRGSGDGGH